MNKIKVASLFTGVAGAEKGIEDAFGRENVEHVAFAEFDKYCNQVLRFRYPDVRNWGDVTKIDWDAFPDHDILWSSSPCQDFSVAGKRAGLPGERSGLFWKHIDCLKAKKPAITVLENVRGLLSSRKGDDWKLMLSAFDEAGYSVKWQVVNALDCEVPQHRQRVIAVGFNKERFTQAQVDSFEFPKPVPRTVKLRDVLEPEGDVDVKYYLGHEQIIKLLSKMNEAQMKRLLDCADAYSAIRHGGGRDWEMSQEPVANTIRAGQGGHSKPHVVVTAPININHGVVVSREDDISTCLGANDWKGLDNHSARTGIAIISQPHGEFVGSVNGDHVGTLREATPNNQRVAEIKCINPDAHQDYRVYGTEGSSPALAANRGGGSAAHPMIAVYAQDNKPFILIGDTAVAIRRLTCVETCRLMSWDDDWNRFGIDDKGKEVPISNSQRCRQCGNGVVSKVVQAVMEQLKTFIESV